MAEVYIVINKIHQLAFTIAIKVFHHLGGNLWALRVDERCTRKTSVLLAKVNVHCGCVDLQVIATNAESPVHGLSAWL